MPSVLKPEFLKGWGERQRSAYHLGKLARDRILFLESIQGWVWNICEARWDKMFNELVEFKKKHGHIRTGKIGNKTSLGHWCALQRTAYKNKKLSSTKIERLNAINFSWSAHDYRWNNMFNELVEFKKKYGHLQVRHSRRQLHSWCSSQRTKKLSAERLSKLDSIGFLWDNLHASRWNSMFNELVEFKKKYGHCYVTSGMLGRWTVKQRVNRKCLSKDALNRLDGVGFVWNFLDVKWLKMFNELVEFKKKYGHLQVPAGSLRGWTGTQRVLAEQKKLSAERLSKLDSIGFLWDPRDSAWNTVFNELVEFKKKYGHMRVPAEIPLSDQCTRSSRSGLSSWCTAQRDLRLEGKLSVVRIQKLKSINFPWNPKHTGNKITSSR